MFSTAADRGVHQQVWHDDHGLELTVTRDATSCLIEVMVPAQELSELTLEILQQAVDQRGLAIGPAICLHRETLTCDYLPMARRSVGRCWLPSHLVFSGLEECYFRIT